MIYQFILTAFFVIAFWINKNAVCQGKFAWQDDYFAVSVSQSHVQAIMQYIRNQEAHHSKKTFAEEANELMHKYGFQLIKDRHEQLG